MERMTRVEHLDAQRRRMAVRLYRAGVPHTMSLSTGALANGAFRYTTTLSAGSHQYYFYFAFSGGTARLPESGIYSYPIVFGHPVYLPRVVSEQ